MIEVKNLRKSYGNKMVFKNLNLSFPEGKTHIILGESGGGKTTLLRLFMGLEKADSGEITGLSGKTISPVFQENRLCEELTVSRNIRMPLHFRGKREKKELLHQIEEALSEIGMPGTAGQSVENLSGGMKRRVALLRALLCPSDIYIFDEAFQGLDEENRKRCMKLIRKVTEGKTVFWITHNPEEGEAFPGSTVYLLSGE